MRDKIKQWLDENLPERFISSTSEELAGKLEQCFKDLGLSNEWVSEIDKIEPDPDFGMPDYYQGFYDAIEAVEKLLPPSGDKS